LLGDGCGIDFEFFFDLVADSAEGGEDLLFGSCGFVGVVEAPEVALALAGEGGADLVDVATDGDDGVDVLVEEFVCAFGSVFGNVEAELGDDVDGERVHAARWVRAGAVNFGFVTDGMLQDGFGHLAAAGVASAEDEDLGCGHRGEGERSTVKSQQDLGFARGGGFKSA
jgi:hypothetical protein